MTRFTGLPVALAAYVAAVSTLMSGCHGQSQPTSPTDVRLTNPGAAANDGAAEAAPLRRVATVGGDGRTLPGDETNYIKLTVPNGELSAGLGSLGIANPTEVPASPVGILALGGTGRFASARSNCEQEQSPFPDPQNPGGFFFYECMTGTLTFAPGTITVSLAYTLAPPGKTPKSYLVEGTIPYTILSITPCGDPGENFVAPVFRAKGQIQGLGNVSVEFGGECLGG